MYGVRGRKKEPVRQICAANMTVGECVTRGEEEGKYVKVTVDLRLLRSTPTSHCVLKAVDTYVLGIVDKQTFRISR